MPRNESTGVFAPVSNTASPAIPYTTIKSADFNALMDDVVDALNSLPPSLLSDPITGAMLAGTAIADSLGYTPANKAGDTFTGAVTVQGVFTAPDLVIDPNAVNAATANATFEYSPEISATHKDAIFVIPTIGTTSSAAHFFAAYNMKFGDDGDPIPAGTLGCFAGFEANITTEQANSDSSEGVHAFGATLRGYGGIELRGSAIVIENDTTASNMFGHVVSLNKVAGGGTQIGYYANCVGPQDCLAAFYVEPTITGGGKFLYAIDCGTRPIGRAAAVQFSGDTDNMEISGELTDTLRINGGGSSGGMILAGTKTGTAGAARFRNTSGGSDLATIDFTSGDVNTVGKYKVGGTQVVSARDTGWSAMTGSSDKATSYATGSVTLAQLAGRVMALQAALTTHGLIGA